MLLAKKKKKYKKVRYRKITFKLSVQQARQIDRFSASHRTTPNKVIKKSIRDFIQRNIGQSPQHEYEVSKNQLALFMEEVPAPEPAVKKKKKS